MSAEPIKKGTATILKGDFNRMKKFVKIVGISVIVIATLGAIALLVKKFFFGDCCCEECDCCEDNDECCCCEEAEEAEKTEKAE